MAGLKKLLACEKGQSMAEYGVIITAVALACLAAFQGFGQIVLHLYDNVTI